MILKLETISKFVMRVGGGIIRQSRSTSFEWNLDITKKTFQTLKGTFVSLINGNLRYELVLEDICTTIYECMVT